MTSEPNLAWIASVVGDPARLSILLALMDGRARTAKELAFLARVAAPTASGHCQAPRQLSRGGRPQGRHRYYRIVSPLVAEMVEAMSVVAATPRAQTRASPRRSGARRRAHLLQRSRRPARVVLADASSDAAICLRGWRRRGHRTRQTFFKDIGVDVRNSGSRGRVFCKPCLDWEERRHHLAGTGSALCEHCWGPAGCTQPRLARADDHARRGAVFASLFGIDMEVLGSRGERAAA